MHKVIFAMIQTLNKKDNLESINNIDILMIDEAHHALKITLIKILSIILIKLILIVNFYE
ncbi:DEAD/DEAH box helicase family protein [Candidatus Phytoplasma sacchari]|nr:DEAD/DEAH box helicase family protein [Candidatus Phytoplasma sacchari]KAB8121920.1 hypothetical protein F2B49_01970 [Candidatus Phytoplasma sacchari]